MERAEYPSQFRLTQWSCLAFFPAAAALFHLEVEIPSPIAKTPIPVPIYLLNQPTARVNPLTLLENEDI